MTSLLPDPRRWLTFVPATLQASPLYTQIWTHLQEDTDLLPLLRLVDADQPLPITFFTAVNFLVLAEPEASLAQFYPSLHPEQTRPASKVYPFFRAFVLEHREALRRLLPTARLQTNEVTRCANLLPAFVLAYRRGDSQPLHMIEIGSSAGLNLRWYRYGYRYHRQNPAEELWVNDPLSPVQLSCELDGQRGFPFPANVTLPRVARCQGIEICPRELHNEEDMRWVRAAIWPEERTRYQTLDAAQACARSTPATLHRGDACDLLPQLLAGIPSTQTPLVWHSYAVHQGSVTVKERLHAQMLVASRRMPLYRVGLEVGPSRPPQVELSEYRDGLVVRHEVLAECSLHGERMTWLADSSIWSVC
ncbi:MAG TPA: DUF2332 domain-containing protein [Ktedonobacteraceae bacterium]|nr:DUF2332 domain-containing protein [Ktedonobacteraceae bacterium]